MTSPVAPTAPAAPQAQPGGNGWGQQFREQYGQAPGQMRTEWDASRAANGIGGGQPQMPPQSALGMATAPRDPRGARPGWVNGGQQWNRFGGWNR
jgi:hypothetical protein